MTSITELAEWSDEKSTEIAKFEADLSQRFIFNNREDALKTDLDEIYASRYGDEDKKWIVLSFGIFLGRAFHAEI